MFSSNGYVHDILELALFVRIAREYCGAWIFPTVFCRDNCGLALIYVACIVSWSPPGFAFEDDWVVFVVDTSKVSFVWKVVHVCEDVFDIVLGCIVWDVVIEFASNL